MLKTSYINNDIIDTIIKTHQREGPGVFFYMFTIMIGFITQRRFP